MENLIFTYTRKEPIRPKEGDTEVKYAEFKDGFNVNKVIRVIGLEKGELLVLLDDIHERIQDVPVQNKQGKTTAYKKDRGTYQSEIYLSKEDADNFFEFIS